MMIGKTREGMCTHFNIKNDYKPEEESELYQEMFKKTSAASSDAHGCHGQRVKTGRQSLMVNDSPQGLNSHINANR
ncbi:hypothetical protein F2Q69_00053768 [Brassica cretica]|uniref:SKP1 component dimerisation domain-containing protein n=1 Tax=Brassica cretica TaxID=69181 RepID=A0A8S9MSX7_BRACR|nr:hypothetical protein F2Q69_00053768 [Brassica cretica]